ncbi:hypothetical protein PSJ59_24225 [Escherichia coli]|uniref:hypothetical protein n=1 Tax=Escherichia coli TaxID=562 RepID=UPI00235A10BA|nr:hypothetical protein [Escherichia coli]MDC9184891.1 hypothetical protein [Escherichia coli]
MLIRRIPPSCIVQMPLTTESNNAEENKHQAISREDLNKYHEETQGLERDMVNEILNSRSRAWKIATAFSSLPL